MNLSMKNIHVACNKKYCTVCPYHGPYWYLTFRYYRIWNIYFGRKLRLRPLMFINDKFTKLRLKEENHR